MLSVQPWETKQMSKEGEKIPIGKFKRENSFWKIPMSPERVPFFYPEHPFQSKILQLLWMGLWEQTWLLAQTAAPWPCQKAACSGALSLGPEGGQCSLTHLQWQSQQHKHWHNVFLPASLPPSPSDVYTTQMCTALQIPVLAVKQSRELCLKKIKKGEKTLNHSTLKTVKWHNCKVVQNKRRNPGCKGLWW